MSAFPEHLRLTGEITERAELLNGAMQLALDGESASAESVGSLVTWTIEVALSWRLGRAGAVALDEGDFTLESGGDEVVAVLDRGTAELDGETGNVEVDAMFAVDGVTGVGIEDGAQVRARLDISSESWTGEFRLVAES